MEATRTLDTTGQLCPIPVIKTQNTINTMSPGETLRVEATDPGVMHDIPAWCRINGHKILHKYQEDRIIHLVIEVMQAD